MRASDVPDAVEHAYPVLAHDLLDARLAPAGAFHRGCQVRELSDGSDSFWIDDLAKIRQLTITAFVMRDPVEKFRAVALREIRANANVVFADQVDHIFDRFEIILDSCIGTALKKRREH